MDGVGGLDDALGDGGDVEMRDPEVDMAPGLLSGSGGFDGVTAGDLTATEEIDQYQ